MSISLASRPWATAPTAADLQTIAEEAYADLPEMFKQHLDGLLIRVEEFPDAEIEQEMALESPFDLLGLYQGVDLSRKSVQDTPEDLDRVFLFRRPILDCWVETGEDLEHLIRHVLVHEIGHHFGLSDEVMEAIEAAAY